jgi:hypothetical protein
MHGGEKQNLLAHENFLRPLGLLHLSENYNWIHSFLVGIWHRSNVTNRV